ncbi:MAG TPA: ABC transporter permease [Rhodocyclaceae bacterium]|nr:MAG: ABC transporter permease [Betaproteobacteria bacterium CG2_30_68_42]PIX75720.1 MAG: ABC transporter permease [Rhodocyclales bacterium CG_4_10_14_3_um_filter_68_10]PJA58077.1 MAG: ABC transporter permease [Rhodocyclales bacterium CG_4_9_14_3_um_filter_68_10]HCX33724.1 ABC transporter permease [Rhodocyclaceae bacterium]
MFRLALRNVFRQKIRSAMTLTAIVFGVTGLVLSGGFVRDMFVQLAEAIIHSQLGHLQVNKLGFFELGSRSPEKYMIADPRAVRAAITAVPGVEDAMARVNFSGLLNNGKTDMPVIGEGVEADREARLGSYLRIVAGRQLNDRDGYGITVGEGLAEKLKLQPGDRVTVVMNTAEGALNSLEFEVAGVFQSFSKDFDARAVRIPLAAAQELMNTRGINTFVVSLKDTAQTDPTARLLADRLDPARFEVKTWYALSDFYQSAHDLYERQFGVLRFIILVMVLLSVANSVNMGAFERVGEFGTMMALGNRRGQVFRLIVTENVLLGLIGAAAGVALGVILALAISAIGIPMPPPPNANIGYTAYIRIVPEELALSFAVGFLATVAASFFPARRVTRIPVVDALRQNV